MQSSISPAASAAIAGHLGAMLNNVFVKYLSDHPAPSHRLPSPPRLKFTYLATFTSLRQAYLVATGMRDDLILAEYLSRAAELVACTVEIADTGLLRFLQDTIAVSLYKFIEFLSKLFPLVGPANQHTIASWMTQSALLRSFALFGAEADLLRPSVCQSTTHVTAPRVTPRKV